jgi:two-component system, NarL family, response regulator DevR
MDKAIRVLVVEDNRLARDMLAALLNAQPGCTVVAAVRESVTGLRRVPETKPHVVLVRASLGNRSSHRFVESVRATAPDVRVIVVDLRLVKEDVVVFAKAGAAGFVLKSATGDDVVATVRAVARGEQVLPPPFTTAILSYIATGSSPRATRAESNAGMPTREQEIMHLIAKGMSNGAIGRHLGIGANTVKSHVRKILARLGLHNRVQIAAYTHRTERSKPNPRTEEDARPRRPAK